MLFSCARSSPLCGLSSSCREWGLLSSCGEGLLITVAFLVMEHGLVGAGFRTCSSSAPSLWCTGLVAPRHVGSSAIRNQTRVSSIGRRILYH